MLFLYKFCYLRIKKILLFSLSVAEYLKLKKNHLLRLLRLRTGATTAVSSAKAFRTSGGLPPLSIFDKIFIRAKPSLGLKCFYKYSESMLVDINWLRKTIVLAKSRIYFRTRISLLNSLPFLDS
jgi:hypothetical protein